MKQIICRVCIWAFLYSNSALALELKTVTAEEYITSNPSPEREAIIDFIVHQFDEKRQSGITQAELDKIWKNEDLRNKLFLVRFQIINQKLYAGSHDITRGHFLKIFNYLQRLVTEYKINDVDFIIHLRDEIPFSSKLAPETMGFPSFILSKDTKNVYENDKLLLPDAYIVQKKWQQIIYNVQQAVPLNPWNKKIEKIFWRGKPSATAHRRGTELKIMDKMPRMALVILSALYPDLIDASFTIPDNNYSKDFLQVLDLITKRTLKNVSETEHLKYKYLISVDGGTCAWLRVPWIMLSNSVLVKQETSKIEWFYPAIKPYVHYVPVNENLTDIFEQLEWMKNHDQELQQISLNAQNFVKNNLMPEDIDAQFVITLNEYSKIQKDEKITPSLPLAKDVQSMSALIKLFWRQLSEKFYNLNIVN